MPPELRELRGGEEGGGEEGRGRGERRGKGEGGKGERRGEGKAKGEGGREREIGENLRGREREGWKWEEGEYPSVSRSLRQTKGSLGKT